jgi:3-oxoacyl-[acyl-carrier protein] reductase
VPVGQPSGRSTDCEIISIVDERSTERPGPHALVTGASRRVGIGHAIAERLSADGFLVTTAGWRNYDDRMPWGADGDAVAVPDFEVDFEDPDATAGLLPAVVDARGPVSVLVLSHCESVDSDIRSTTVESFDRHMAVNARATWQLVEGFAEQYAGSTGRIVSITSDHTAGNLPYGASKGAMDRIVLAAAVELADLGVTANVVNPGATDTGWMTDDIAARIRATNLQGRIGTPQDAANLVSFLCSAEGGWINGQLLHSDGGR